jgi:hypothetical protein
MGGSKPTVTLVFAGDEAKLTAAMDKVGSSAEQMGRRVADTSDGFTKAGEAADTLDTRAMGFRDTMTGVQDSMLGVSDIAKGNLFEGFLTLGMGVGDLGSGLYNFLIPALAQAKLGMMAQAAWSGIVSAATTVWAGAQQLLNLAFWASPIGLTVIAIAALVAVIVVIAVKTDWFQRLWAAAWDWIKSAAVNVWDWLKDLPGRIGSAFSGLANIVSAPFKAGFNLVSDAWNNTVGRLSWTIPGWVPELGGKSISAPRLPHFHTGGVVPGLPSQEVLAVLRGGERVSAGAQPGTTVRLVVGGGADGALAEVINHLIRIGQIQLAPA